MPKKSKSSKNMKLKRMDNVLIVVDDLEATKAFSSNWASSLRAKQRSKGLWSGD